MDIAEYALFPTRLVTIQFPDVDGLNRELDALFASREEFHEWYAEWLRTAEAAELERREWLEELAGRWQLVRVPESLTGDERERQADRIDRAMGLAFGEAARIVKQLGETGS